MKTRPDWNSLKKEYIETSISLRSLAQKHAINFSTLSKRSLREGWYRARQERADMLAVGLKRAMEVEVAGAGMSAAQFLTRSINETMGWLDKIQQLSARGELTPDSLSKLVQAWKATLSAGREAFRLDDQPSAGVANHNHLHLTLADIPPAQRRAPYMRDGIWYDPEWTGQGWKYVPRPEPRALPVPLDQPTEPAPATNSEPLKE